MSKFLFYSIFAFFIFIPFVLNAQIEITEIMYDLEGDDDGPDNKQRREWIEIYNSGGGIDLSDWKLYEAKTNHGINSVPEGGGVFLSANSYAVIVDKPDVFQAEHPTFSGIIFDSAFDLNNTGETLIIRNPNLVDIDKVSYSKGQGANGDGNSLQKMSDGGWGACAPTPGAPTGASCQPQADIATDNPDDESQGETLPQTVTPAATYKIEPQIFAQIIPPLDAPIAGADFFFEAKAVGLENKPLENAEYQWTFGDGGKAQGQKVLHNYQYPSDYLIVLEVISGKYVGSHRLKIKVIPSDIIISEVGVTLENNFIELHNPSTYELNLSWWRLRVDNNYFTLPKNTILLPKNKIRFSSRTTNLFPQQNSLVNLLYPNGSVASHYVKETLPLKNEIIPTVKKIQIVPVVSAPVQTQMASIQKSVEVEPPQMTTNKSLLSTTTLLQSQPETESQAGRNLFNKWNLSLAGIISLATVGVFFTNKLDR